ncbi:futalosine hydrolase [Streptomyces sp. NPDC087908]|uniref:futalosine hydrolase n=1 Tax=unclassified Streptomyces TaxID=2593676 RepID=UPI0011CD6248|nr:futalosine hydrolase [Streptomyces sp. adm13(2018)]TXS16282.1 futalosine hydrolase [Streptomyces sp. adm13(2018)]
MVHRILIVTAVAAEADSVSTGLGLGAPELLPLPGGVVLRRHTDASNSPDASPSPGPPGSRLRVDVLVGGVGPASVAASTGTALAHAALTDTPGPSGAPGPSSGPSGSAPPPPYDLVVSAGIAGGFQPLAPLGSVVVASAVVAADLGAQTPDGYLTVDELGFGRSVHPVPEALTGRIAAVLAAAGLPHTVAPVLTVSTVTGTADRAAELAGLRPGAAAEAMEGFGVAEAATGYAVPVVEIRAVSNAVGPRDRAAWRIGEALEALRHTFELLGKTVFLELEPS